MCLEAIQAPDLKKTLMSILFQLCKLSTFQAPKHLLRPIHIAQGIYTVCASSGINRRVHRDTVHDRYILSRVSGTFLKFHCLNTLMRINSTRTYYNIVWASTQTIHRSATQSSTLNFAQSMYIQPGKPSHHTATKSGYDKRWCFTTNHKVQWVMVLQPLLIQLVAWQYMHMWCVQT